MYHSLALQLTLNGVTVHLRSTPVRRLVRQAHSRPYHAYIAEKPFRVAIEPLCCINSARACSGGVVEAP